ncbi:MAG: hypothetical protein JXB39_15615 [Deltaproteobacteria bacterium]|nr:hypothetical protein [Deltaproteobacteria bacterium]
MSLALLPSAVLLVAFSGSAIAGQDEAETCAREQVSNAYPLGWAVRTLTRIDLGQGETCNYLLTLYAGVEYRIASCGDLTTREVDLVLYDGQGQPKAQDVSTGRAGELWFRPPTTATYLLAVRVSERTPPPATQPGVSRSSVATAVMYK